VLNISGFVKSVKKFGVSNVLPLFLSHILTIFVIFLFVVIVSQVFVLLFVLTLNLKIDHFWVVNTDGALQGFGSNDFVDEIQGALRKFYWLNCSFWIHVWIYKL